MRGVFGGAIPRGQRSRVHLLVVSHRVFATRQHLGVVPAVHPGHGQQPHGTAGMYPVQKGHLRARPPRAEVLRELVLEGGVAVRVEAQVGAVEPDVGVHVDAIEADGDALIRHEVRGRVSEVLAVLQRSGASRENAARRDTSLLDKLERREWLSGSLDNLLPAAGGVVVPSVVSAALGRRVRLPFWSARSGGDWGGATGAARLLLGSHRRGAMLAGM